MSSSSPRKRKFNDTSTSPSSPSSSITITTTNTKYTTKPKPKGRLCSVLNCTKQVQQGGVCCRHGAKTTRATCSHDNCTNVAKRGGLCRRHGAFNLETCAFVGCRRCVKRGRKFCDGHYDNNAIAATVDAANSDNAAGANIGGEDCGVTTTTTTTTTISTTTTDKMSSSNRSGQCGPCICSHEGCSNVSNRGGVCNRHDCAGVSRTKRHTNNTPPNTTSSSLSSLVQSPDNMYQLGGYNNNNTTSNPTPLVTGSTGSSVEVEVESSSTFMQEPGLQFNFLCDYFEDMYEEFPV